MTLVVERRGFVFRALQLVRVGSLRGSGVPMSLERWPPWASSALVLLVLTLFVAPVVSGGEGPTPEESHFAFRVSAMGVLFGWAVLNILVGGLGAARLRASRFLQVFLGANAAWNIVNLAISVGGGWSAAQHSVGSLEGFALVREMVFFQKVILVNVGLDVGYALSGLIVFLWGRSLADPWRRAVGLALVVQGIFLFAFDIYLAMAVQEQLSPLMEALG